MTDFRALCEELVEELEVWIGYGDEADCADAHVVVDRARAALTDHEPNDLSHLSDAEFNALCPQGEHAPGPEPLSPEAQAVLDAAFVPWETIDTPQSIAAAVLRAAVVQVAPVSTNARQMKIRNELLAIANELEGMSN
jgi:hypothetical protein